MSTDQILLPSAYFGNIEYFFYLWKYDQVVIDIHEPYQKQSYRSRTIIGGANGALALSVPVERPNGNQTQMLDVLISNAEDWRKDHYKAIESAYQRTPYFEFYVDQLKEIVYTNHSLLWQLNHDLCNWLIEKIGLTVACSFSTQQTPIQTNDLRMLLHPKKNTGFNTHHYIQPFEERHGFLNNLSILDLLFNEGPNSICILQESTY